MRISRIALGQLVAILCVCGCKAKLSSKSTGQSPATVATNAPSSSSGLQPTIPATPAATLNTDAVLGISLGTLAQGAERDVQISLSYQGNVPVTAVSLDGTSPELSFKGGSFPGLGGTCGGDISSNCDLMLTFAAGAEIQNHLSLVKVTYSSTAGTPSIEIPVSATTRFLYDADSFTSSDRMTFSLAGPIGAWTDGTKLLVLSPNQGRILGWNTFPQSNKTPPDFVLGAPEIGVAGPKFTDARTCHTPSDIDSDGTRIVVSCYFQHRVLIWNQWPTANFAPASVVVGQPDFHSKTYNTGGVSAATLRAMRGVALAGDRLYVADTGNHRVLVFDHVPTTNGQSADRIIGQSTATGTAWAATATGLRNPTDAVVAGGRLFVSDNYNNRVLAYDSDYPATGAAASFALGQTLLTTGQANAGGSAAANTLSGPKGLAATADSLFVADALNRRVLRFSPVPTGTGATAIQVFGQPDFITTADDDFAVTGKSLDDPNGLAVGGSRIVIADTANNRLVFHDVGEASNYPTARFVWGQSSPANEYSGGIPESATHCEHGFVARNDKHFVQSCFYGNRILVWDGAPKSPSDPATVVIGQTDFTSTLANAGGTPSANSLNRAYRSLLADDTLWVSDTNNHRILRYSTVPTTNFAAADLVIGQATFTGGVANRGGAASALTLNSPTGLVIANSRMLVSDSGNNRVLVFDSVPSALDASANLVLGQATMTGTVANRGGTVAADTLSGPADVWTDGTRLAVVDGTNNRVLLWNSFPTTNGQAADLVLGQSDFAGSLANRGQPLPVRGGFDAPSMVAFHRGNLFVLDRNNNRILVWKGWPTVSGQMPDRVAFQKDFESADYGVGENTVADVNAMSVFGDSLIVTDRMNFRLLGVPLSEIVPD